MNVIPQSPPIKVKVDLDDGNGQKVPSLGRIVAWRVDEEGDGIALLTPMIWFSPDSFAVAHEGTDVRYYDEWE